MSSLFSRFQSKLPQFALLLITIVWGATFVVVKYGLTLSSPVLFVALRFAAAALAVSFISWKSLKGIRAFEVYAGAAIGLVIALGYSTQTIGLQTISSSESAFLTALYVPLVPMLLWLLFAKKPHVMTWLGAALAFLGLLFLTGNGLGTISLNFGQLLTLLSSIAIALEIILISYFAPKVNTQRVTVLQLIFASLFCFCIAPCIGETQLPECHPHLFFILIGLWLASACIQLVMNWAQQMVDPSQAAIIYAGEPIWASLFARLTGERLPFVVLLGGFLVVLGIIASEWRPQSLKKKSPKA